MKKVLFVSMFVAIATFLSSVAYGQDDGTADLSQVSKTEYRACPDFDNVSISEIVAVSNTGYQYLFFPKADAIASQFNFSLVRTNYPEPPDLSSACYNNPHARWRINQYKLNMACSLLDRQLC